MISFAIEWQIWLDPSEGSVVFFNSLYSGFFFFGSFFYLLYLQLISRLSFCRLFFFSLWLTSSTSVLPNSFVLLPSYAYSVRLSLLPFCRFLSIHLFSRVFYLLRRPSCCSFSSCSFIFSISTLICLLSIRSSIFLINSGSFFFFST